MAYIVANRAHPQDPLFFPTPSGWSNNPGSVESYVANAKAVLYDEKVVHSQDLENGTIDGSNTPPPGGSGGPPRDLVPVPCFGS